jgi:DNA polymerase-1
MTKLVLIDGHAILHRAYHALPPLTNRKGQQVNAVYGFTSMLLKVVSDLKPTHLAVCFDRPEPTFRKEKFAAYQSNRPETDKELVSQFEVAKEVARAMNIPVLEKVGFEADDLLGTIATQAKKDKLEEVVIVTGDRDILQLVNDEEKIEVFMPSRGLSEGKLYKEKDAHERMGVPARLIPDYKALVGDPSDNYPGVAGIGPKTAEKLLEKYDGIDHLYKHLADIEPKVKEKLVKNKDLAILSHNLATIVRDVPIEFEIDKMSKWSVVNPKILEFFDDLGFKSLTKRVEELDRKMVKENQMSLI